jgi:hypothetical protein
VLLWNSKINRQCCSLGDELPVGYIGRLVQHDLGSFDRIGVGVFVRQINDLFYAGLYNDFCAFVAWKEPHINSTSPKITGDGVENRIQLSMTDIGIFGIKKISLAVPRQVVIGAAPGEAVIPYTDNFVFSVGDTCTYLGTGVFTSLRREEGNRHKIFVPGKIIGSF